MDFFDWQPFLAALLIGLSTSVGGLWMTKYLPNWYKNSSFLLFICFGTGILFSVLFLEFLPQVFHQTDHHHAAGYGALIVVGVFFVILMERYVAPYLDFLETPACDHDHSHDHDHKKHPETEHQHHLVSHQAACSAVGCLAVCTFFDGAGIKAAFALEAQTGWLTSLGLLFHVLPDGALAAGVAIAGGASQRAAKLISCVIGASILLGFVFISLLGSLFSFQEYILPFASGILMYVCFIHLLPVALKHRFWLVGVGAGFFLFFGIHLLFHSH